MADVSADVTARSEALAERLFQATLSTWDIATVYLGHRLGLYRALSDVEPATSRELATAAPGASYPGVRVTTMFSRPGSGRPSDSQVRRPMISG